MFNRAQVGDSVSHGAERLPRWLRTMLGTAGILVGTFLALRPFSSMAVLVLAIVVALVVSALADLARRRVSSVLRGVVQLLAALALVLWPGAGLGVVTLVAAAILAVNGVFDLVAGARQRGIERWTGYLVGTASILVGVLALAWPDVAVLVIAAAFGVRLVVQGWRLLASTWRRREAPATPRPGWLRLGGSVMALIGALVLVALSLLLSRATPRPDAFYAAPDVVPAEPGRLVRSEPFMRGVPGGALAWRILYTTTRDEGLPALASGIVVAPAVTAEPTPVIAWAHGTTGWAPGCAPSVLDEPFESGALFVLDRVVAEGWTLVMTDYVGLGTPSPHPYLIGQGEGRSVLDALRAARELPGASLGDETVVWGHSQGGHAALWAGILEPSYAPELSLVGVVALAPAANLPDLVEVVGSMTGGSLFAAYVAQAYTDAYPDVGFDDYIRPGARAIVREMAQRCLSEPSSLVSLVGSLVLDKPIWRVEPSTGSFAARLAENTPTGGITVPLLLGQGLADTLIRPEAQDAYVAGRCTDGDGIDYRSYEGRDHVGLVAADSPAIDDLLRWTRARFAGALPAVDSCG